MSDLVLSNLTIQGHPVGLFYEEPTPTFDSVTIGTQTWMAENLAIDDGQGGIYTQTVNYGQGDVVEHYYTWEAAVRVASDVDGWHLPLTTEWTTLSNYVGGSSVGTKLKSTYGWNNDGNGTDDYGFAVFPAGQINRNGSFYNLGSKVYFWTANQSSATYANTRWFINTNSGIYTTNEDKMDRYTVRLIKDT